ncbi:50S ribosomal protein L1 [Coccinella septempunctata]|uniref:50S ribosomal protein L1 n=1 Tax=Coccinella septempunctata TaxID=41139 RepID=UPI001D08BC6E|nr:50S ribosomal protein L1 [Coccinella septempunctata]
MLSLSQRILISPLVKSWKEPVQFTLTRNYAARRGTRERKSKKKVKVVVEKVGFIPHNQRNREALMKGRPSRKIDDSWMRTPTDEIYCTKYFKWKVYPFEEAIRCISETHHLDMYNQPNATVQAVIELYMQGEKKTKFVEDFNRICGIKHHFPHNEERTIVAFAKDIDAQEAAKEAGALLAGGVDLIKNIQNGKVVLTDFEFVVSHPDILHELSSLRGLMKKKYPSYKLGTIDVNLDEVVERYMHGVNYKAVKDEFEKDFGVIEAPIGTLDMDAKHLEENFGSLVNDVMTMKPKRAGDFILRTLIKSAPSPEIFKVDFNLYLPKTEKEVGEEKEVEEVDQSVVL